MLFRVAQNPQTGVKPHASLSLPLHLGTPQSQNPELDILLVTHP